jgi:threonine synthase
MQVFCPECGAHAGFEPPVYRCGCGGAWEPLERDEFKGSDIDPSCASLWRYQRLFGLPDLDSPVSLGAGWTPLLETVWGESRAQMKMEYLAPTGSFKDRGTEVEVNVLAALGITEVVEDSSGNAGASLAAYVARLGMRATIYAPQDALPAKLAQIRVFGARLVAVPGERSEATRAVLSAVEGGAIYASHAYSPAYLLGQQTFAWEIWEQLGENLPDAVVIPVGQGGLLMGAWLGFRRLLLAEQIEKIPRLFAVQPEWLAPIPKANMAGLEDIPPAAELAEKSAADGLAIARPVRARRILQALRESGGQGLTVTEEETAQAYRDLAARGFFVEASSAVAAAALPQVYQLVGMDAKVVVALTGSGLKSQLS